ncbi:MAG: hypothetical protein EOM91_21780, partial [Sphingobacteriia bacterium]|nr:hypothetical protein [Sphingobacteriia bacterium]
MVDLVTFPIPTKVLDPADYPEFVGPATEWQATATHLQARPVGGDTWVDVVALDDIKGADGATGAQGDPGADGRTILSGSGAPADALGANGDYYLDIAATLIYGPKAAGAWPAGVLLKGPAGASDLLPIASYTETGATLAFVAEADGDIEIPCDGKVYQLTITGDCSLVTGTVPTPTE